MTVAELIAMLQALPPDARVLVHGYEDGYKDVDEIEFTRVITDPTWGEKWYYGPYTKAQPDDAAAEYGVLIPGSGDAEMAQEYATFPLNPWSGGVDGAA